MLVNNPNQPSLYFFKRDCTQNRHYISRFFQAGLYSFQLSQLDHNFIHSTGGLDRNRSFNLLSV